MNSSDCPLKPDFDALEQILPTTFNFLDEIWFFGVGTAIIGTTKFFGQENLQGIFIIFEPFIMRSGFWQFVPKLQKRKAFSEFVQKTSTTSGAVGVS